MDYGRGRHHHLVISEVDLVVTADDDIRCWEIDLILDSSNYEHNLLVIDPFNDEAAASCKWYLEKYAAESPLERSRAEKVEESLQAYARKLFDQLKLQHFAESASKSSASQTLVIDVVDALRPLKLSSTSIHRLHWEALESEFLWPKSLNKVIVQRRAAHEGRRNPIELQLDALHLAVEKEPVFNVLVVMARNLSRDTSTYQDVDPFLGLKALMAVRKALIDAKANVRLEIEVVRPGTFAAFRKHLQRSLVQNGPDYFDLIHFDLHGRVAVQKSDKQKVAWLLFKAGEQGSSLQPVPAATVIKCLQGHHIKLAVFNSCNSATSNAGLNANLAGLLAANGIPGVLAMSFQLLNTTATSFLSSFYQEFFLQRITFGDAAARARALLRVQPERGARFGLRVDVQDWLIPVAYTNGEDLFAFPATAEVGLETLTTTSQPVKVSELIVQERLVGRDLEILRLEDTLIHQKVLHFHGRPGDGKSALFSEVARIWTETSFATQIALITQPAQTFQGFLAGLKLNLRWKGGAVYDSDQSNIEQHDEGSLMQQLCSTSTILLFDHMNFLQFCDFAHRLSASFLSHMAQFLHDLLSRSMESPNSKPLYMVFVGYDSYEYNEWWSQNFGLLNALRVGLPTLDLSSSITFADMVLKRSGGNGSWRRGREIDGIVQVVELLERNPMAMRIVLPEIVRTGQPVTEFYRELLTGELSLDQLLKENDLVSLGSHMAQLLAKTLQDLRRTNKIHWFCAIGLFWHQGPDHFPEFSGSLSRTIANISQGEVEEVRPSTDRIDPGMLSFMVLNLVHAFRCDATSLRWIHPLCTIMLRKLLQERLLSHSPAWIQGLHVAFLMAMEERVSEQCPAELWNVSEDKKNALAADLQKHLPNIIFAMHVCCKPSLGINLDRWPLSLGTIFTLAVRWPTAEKMQLHPFLEGLIQRFVILNGGLKVQHKYEHFILSAISHFVVLSNDQMGPREEAIFDAVQSAMQIMKSSEKLPASTRPEIRLQVLKSVLWMTGALGCLTRGLTDRADEAWQEHHRVEKQTGILPGESAEELLDEVLGDWSPTKIGMATCAVQVCTLSRALVDNSPSDNNGLLFDQGDVIIITGPYKPGWYEGAAKGRLGIFEARQAKLLDTLTDEEATKLYRDLENALFMTPLRSQIRPGHQPTFQERPRLGPTPRAGDNIYLLSPVQTGTWMAWFRGDTLEIDVSDVEVDPHALDVLQLDRLADENLGVLELGVAWEWVRNRMSTDPTDKIDAFPLLGLRRFLALRYNRLYRHFLQDDLPQKHAFLRGLRSDASLFSSITDMTEIKGGALEELTKLETATDSGGWSVATRYHHRLAYRAVRENNHAANIYHIKKLLELYSGIRGAENMIRELKLRERLTRMTACEVFVSQGDTSRVYPELLETLLHGLRSGQAWFADFIREHGDNESSHAIMRRVETQEAWMDAYEPASSFNIDLDFREGG